MNDDFNTPLALSNLYALIKETNQKTLSRSQSAELIKLWQKWNRVFGLKLSVKEETLPSAVTELLTKRKLARQQKDFTLADEIRTKINQLGFEVEDTPAGQVIKRSNGKK